MPSSSSSHESALQTCAKSTTAEGEKEDECTQTVSMRQYMPDKRTHCTQCYCTNRLDSARDHSDSLKHTRHQGKGLPLISGAAREEREKEKTQRQDCQSISRSTSDHSVHTHTEVTDGMLAQMLQRISRAVRWTRTFLPLTCHVYRTFTCHAFLNRILLPYRTRDDRRRRASYLDV